MWSVLYTCSVVMYVLIFIYSVCHPLSSLCMSLCMSFFISGGCDSFNFFHLLYLGNISEPNPNCSIFYFLFFCPSPNITWPVPFPSGPIVHCHIPCFHLMFFVTTVIINTEYINNIYMYCTLPEVTLISYWVILEAVGFQNP